MPRTIDVRIICVSQQLDESFPILLLLRYVVSEVGEDNLYESLGFAICLMLVRCSLEVSDCKYCVRYCDELIYELGAVAGQKLRQCTVWDEPLAHEKICNVRGGRL